MPTSVRIERAPRTVLETLQLKRLQQVVARCGAPRSASSSRTSTRSTDLEQIPFTVKEDLRAHYPLGMLVVPHDELRRIHASSGTRGKPTVVAYTEHDLACGRRSWRTA